MGQYYAFLYFSKLTSSSKKNDVLNKLSFLRLRRKTFVKCGGQLIYDNNNKLIPCNNDNALLIPCNNDNALSPSTDNNNNCNVYY